jgi:hypothetical protein
MSASLLLIAAFVAGGALSAHARDDGRYSDVPQNIHDWFNALENRQLGISCCKKADCARTEARIRGGKWEAKAPDGSWIAVPRESVVLDQGNPTGEAILCSYREEDGWGVGWGVLCFVPGPRKLRGHGIQQAPMPETT